MALNPIPSGAKIIYQALNSILCGRNFLIFIQATNSLFCHWVAGEEKTRFTSTFQIPKQILNQFLIMFQWQFRCVQPQTLNLLSDLIKTFVPFTSVLMFQLQDQKVEKAIDFFYLFSLLHSDTDRGQKFDGKQIYNFSY